MIKVNGTGSGGRYCGELFSVIFKEVLLSLKSCDGAWGRGNGLWPKEVETKKNGQWFSKLKSKIKNPMASNQEFVDFIVDQIENAGEITARKMFGEYGLYSDGKIFALICDNKLFVKPTEAGRNFMQEVVEAPPYPGAKPSFLIEDKVEDREWLSQLVRITVRELPEPKPKKKKK